MSKKKSLIIILVVILGVSLACGKSTSSQLADAARESTLSATRDSSEAQGKSTDAEPTLEKETEPTATPVDLVISQPAAVVQDGIHATVLFVVENPNPTLAIESSQYQVSIYDESGGVLDTDSGYIEVVLPAEKLGLAVDVYLDEGQKAASAEVQLSQGDPETTDQKGSPFSVDLASYLPDDNFPRITGEVMNKLNTDITNVRLTAIAYDAAGTIIGGGYTYENFLPAGEKTGVEVGVTVKSKPEKVELYPTLSGLSSLSSSGGSTDLLELGPHGFSQDSSEVGVAYFVKNKDAENSLEGSMYRITAYDTEGTVIGTDSGYITILMASENLGCYADVFVLPKMKTDHVVVQVLGGDIKPVDLESNPFSTDQVVFNPDQYIPTITGIILNGLNQDVTEMRVSAVAFNEGGEVIGGGYTYVDFLPASGQTAVEISVQVSEPPAWVELHPTLSGMSIFEAGTPKATSLILVAQGFAQENTQVGVAFIVENTDNSLPMERAQYQVAVYDADGNVLATDSGYFNLIFSEEKMGGYSEMYLPDGKTVDRAEVQIKQGDLVVQALEENPFSADQINFNGGNYSDKATGIILNTLSEDVSFVEVVAVAYNDSGEIIGGGRTYLDFIPANGQSAAEVLVTVASTPARIELFAGLTSLSSLGD